MTLPLGWHTDLAVLRLTGSTVDRRGDHLVVRTTANPLYHWGNFVLVTDERAVDRPEHWLEVFEREFPDAAHRSIGLVTEPADEASWTRLDLVVEHDDVLATDTCPESTPVPQGYLVRQIRDDVEWEQSTGLRVAEFAEADSREAAYERTTTEVRRSMVGREDVAWFGAFHGDRLVAELGIVDCGDGIARYQAVVTGADHRRRGLAGHLLGVAARWARDHGAHTWVIVAEDGAEAARLYRSRGFRPAGRGARAYRRPGPAEG